MTQETTIEDTLKKYMINDGRADILYFEDAVKAMTEYASLNRQGCRFKSWLEERIENYEMEKLEHGKKERIQARLSMLKETLENYNRWIEPCATSSENYWQKRCEAAEKIIHMNDVFANEPEWKAWEELRDNPIPISDNNDSIRFANWIKSEGYFIDGKELWENDSIGNNDMFTTEALYKLYNPKSTPSPTGDRDCEELIEAAEGLIAANKGNGKSVMRQIEILQNVIHKAKQLLK